MNGLFLSLCGACGCLLPCAADATIPASETVTSASETTVPTLETTVPTLETTVPASEAYLRLRQGLEQEIALLSGVKNAETATSTLPALREHHARLTAMKSECPRTELWRYIDNTPHLKGALIELVQKLALEYQRLEKASYFSCNELRLLLEPQLTPDASRSKGE